MNATLSSGGDKGRWSLVSLAVGWLAAVPLVVADPGPPPEATSAAVLDLQANGFSVGGLLDAPAVGDGPRTTLLWKSDLFATPLELSIPEIIRIRFPRREAVVARPGSWRFELHGGDVILGTLEGIDGDRITVSSPDVGAAGPLLGGLVYFLLAPSAPYLLAGVGMVVPLLLVRRLKV